MRNSPVTAHKTVQETYMMRGRKARSRMFHHLVKTLAVWIKKLVNKSIDAPTSSEEPRLFNPRRV